MALDAIGIGLLVMGAALFVLELVHPGAFLLIPGTVLLAGAFLYILLPDFLLHSLFGPLVDRRCGGDRRPGIGSIPSSPGGWPLSTARWFPILPRWKVESGSLPAPASPDSMSGKVQVDSEIWSARGDEVIPIGTKVRVVGGAGVCVLVRPVAPELVS